MSSTDSQAHDKNTDYWAESYLPDRIAEVLAAAGKDASNTTVDDLSSFDQRHVLGSEATMRLAKQAGITAADHVLDVGSGFGGPARMLAHQLGCRVTGIELTEASVDTANLFNDLTGMSDRVTFQQGDGADLPFDGESFDVVWTQHIAQNVPDKRAFFLGMARVLKPGGRLVIHDLYRAAPDIPCHYPSCWGYDPTTEFLASDDEMRTELDRNGLTVETWADTTVPARGWVVDYLRNLGTDEDLRAGSIPGLDSSLLGQPQQLQTMLANAVADIDAGAIGFFEAIARKP